MDDSELQRWLKEAEVQQRQREEAFKRKQKESQRIKLEERGRQLAQEAKFKAAENVMKRTIQPSFKEPTKSQVTIKEMKIPKLNSKKESSKQDLSFEEMMKIAEKNDPLKLSLLQKEATLKEKNRNLKTERKILDEQSMRMRKTEKEKIDDTKTKEKEETTTKEKEKIVTTKPQEKIVNTYKDKLDVRRVRDMELSRKIESLRMESELKKSEPRNEKKMEMASSSSNPTRLSTPMKFPFPSPIQRPAFPRSNTRSIANNNNFVALNQKKRDLRTIEEIQEEMRMKRQGNEHGESSKQVLAKQTKEMPSRDVSKQATLKQLAMEEKSSNAKPKTRIEVKPKSKIEEKQSYNSSSNANQRRRSLSPPSNTKKRRRLHEESDPETYYTKNYSSIIANLFNYNPKRYVDSDEDDLSDMEADLATIRREEARSARMAKLEDEREEERLKALAEAKRKRLETAYKKK